jgi:hypothetical protein
MAGHLWNLRFFTRKTGVFQIQRKFLAGNAPGGFGLPLI